MGETGGNAWLGLRLTLRDDGAMSEMKEGEVCFKR